MCVMRELINEREFSNFSPRELRVYNTGCVCTFLRNVHIVFEMYSVNHWDARIVISKVACYLYGSRFLRITLHNISIIQKSTFNIR